MQITSTAKPPIALPVVTNLSFDLLEKLGLYVTVYVSPMVVPLVVLVSKSRAYTHITDADIGNEKSPYVLLSSILASPHCFIKRKDVIPMLLVY